MGVNRNNPDKRITSASFQEKRLFFTFSLQNSILHRGYFGTKSCPGIKFGDKTMLNSCLGMLLFSSKQRILIIKVYFENLWSHIVNLSGLAPPQLGARWNEYGISFHQQHDHAMLPTLPVHTMKWLHNPFLDHQQRNASVPLQLLDSHQRSSSWRYKPQSSWERPLWLILQYNLSSTHHLSSPAWHQMGTASEILHMPKQILMAKDYFSF